MGAMHNMQYKRAVFLIRNQDSSGSGSGHFSELDPGFSDPDPNPDTCQDFKRKQKQKFSVEKNFRLKKKPLKKGRKDVEAPREALKTRNF
jgi:hypothetical protein